MDAIQIAILSCTLALCVGGSLLSLHSYRKLTQNHRKKITNLASTIEMHKFQIEKRNNFLKRYDFLEYNLEEVLQPQPEIDVPI